MNLSRLWASIPRDQIKKVVQAIALFLAVSVGYAAFLAGGLILGGYVLMKYWEWFVTPLGLPALELFQATGINLMGRYLTYQKVDLNEEYEGIVMLLEAIAYPIGILLIGYIVHMI